MEISWEKYAGTGRLRSEIEGILKYAPESVKFRTELLESHERYPLTFVIGAFGSGKSARTVQTFQKCDEFDTRGYGPRELIKMVNNSLSFLPLVIDEFGGLLAGCADLGITQGDLAEQLLEIAQRRHLVLIEPLTNFDPLGKDNPFDFDGKKSNYYRGFFENKMLIENSNIVFSPNQTDWTMNIVLIKGYGISPEYAAEFNQMSIGLTRFLRNLEWYQRDQGTKEPKFTHSDIFLFLTENITGTLRTLADEHTAPNEKFLRMYVELGLIKKADSDSLFFSGDQGYTFRSKLLENRSHLYHTPFYYKTLDRVLKEK